MSIKPETETYFVVIDDDGEFDSDRDDEARFEDAAAAKAAAAAYDAEYEDFAPHTVWKRTVTTVRTVSEVPA